MMSSEGGSDISSEVGLGGGCPQASIRKKDEDNIAKCKSPHEYNQVRPVKAVGVPNTWRGMLQGRRWPITKQGSSLDEEELTNK